jgi:small subunit ribosomal protein S9
MENKKISSKTVDTVEFKGKFTSAIGRRKTAAAQVRLYKNGKGLIMVNKKKLSQYFSNPDIAPIISQPLKLSGLQRDLNISVLVKGGGQQSQAEAVRHGLANALIKFDKALRPALKAKGWLSRDARKKERKKPGLKKARRAPQWSKR